MFSRSSIQKAFYLILKKEVLLGLVVQPFLPLTWKRCFGRFSLIVEATFGLCDRDNMLERLYWHNSDWHTDTFRCILVLSMQIPEDLKLRLDHDTSL